MGNKSFKAKLSNNGDKALKKRHFSLIHNFHERKAKDESFDLNDGELLGLPKTVRRATFTPLYPVHSRQNKL